MLEELIVKDLHWNSDFNGYEVGFPEIPAVGLYCSSTLNCCFYIDTENRQILEVMIDEED